MKNMLVDHIWRYIGSRVDEGVLPDEDTIYTKFKKYFEVYDYDPSVIEETVKRYCSCSDLDGVKIEWEGRI